MVGRRRNKPDGEPSIMLQRQLSIGPVADSHWPAVRAARRRCMQGKVRGPQGMPVRFIVTQQPAQEVTISVPGLAGRSATELHLTHTQDGPDVAYPRRAID